ncbi:hypothetical protein CAPTEDRAFT_119581 [Capitella teleta]|uniref:Speriolin C-terminal domain-containing protein n=1 Tax=Capitella teleta TaxID=283909 RepID=R7UDB9_CAPTE|nr:hypothetical protein CAPTEDRAFT_119581 [Capitella teleta]|eukprot:ELU01267.1 hypothetical protein CAPTEDRAFT_119581 [Capitella teleta]
MVVAPKKLSFNASRTLADDLRREGETEQWGKRILGEIAYQLDRRILRYIFCRLSHNNQDNQQRIYGYYVGSIEEQIIENCKDSRSGNLDLDKKYLLEFRYKHIMLFLRDAGYDKNIHPKVTKALVNKYGLLPTPGPRSSLRDIGPHSFSQLKDYVTKLANAEEIRDIMVLLVCITQMAKEDGEPIFIWG